MAVRISPHALEQINTRKLSSSHVIQVATNPQQIIQISSNRHVAQSKFRHAGKEYLLRVLIESVGEDQF